MNITKEDLDKARLYPIESLISDMGIPIKRRGEKVICSSPFSEDIHPSFYIYPENTFYDYSTGIGGDSITFVKEINNCGFIDAIRSILKKDFSISYKSRPRIIKKKYNKFDISFYKTRNKAYVNMIEEYAERRKFDKGTYINAYYNHPYYYDDENGNEKCDKKHKVAVGFPHIDEYGNICGIKFRFINDVGSQRFSSRGRLSYYLIENVIGGKEPTMYIVESETSSSTLSRFLKENNKSFVIISFGGVGSTRSILPFKWSHLKNRKLVIDFDGDEDKYVERLRRYELLKCDVITLKLEKGEDINSLYCENKINDYKSILI